MFHFVANLKPYTFDPCEGMRRFDSYLLSVDYLAEHESLATRAVTARRLLVADNGNFDHIGELIAAHRDLAVPLDEARRAEERKLGRYARPGELSATLTERYRALAGSIAATCKAPGVKATRETLARQVRMRPSYLIGMEEFPIPVLTALGAEREYLCLPPSWYARWADKAVQHAVKARAGAYGPCPVPVFAGLHAMDYDTARAAGRAAGDAGLDGIATGLGAALEDRSFTDFRIEDGAVVPLAGAVPRPYLRVIEIAAGLSMGFAERTGRRPRLHALGVGTPILLPLLALLGDAGTHTATDSTAPIQDAWTSSTIAVYVDDPAPLKLRAHVIAQRWLEGRAVWTCACPPCRSFGALYPPRIGKARAWWKAQGRRALVAGDMRADSALSELLPWLSSPADASVRRAAGLSRTGHNHWVLQRIESAARRRASPVRLRAWVANVVAAYEQSPADAAWKRAVREAWQLADATSRKLEGALAGGLVVPAGR